MAADERVKKSSEAESQPSRPAVVESSLPVSISYAPHDAASAEGVISAGNKILSRNMSLPE
jgi:hypothetical protein